MILYLFALAAVIAGIGIMMIYRQTLDAIIENPEKMAEAQQRFFLRIAFVEVLPILLVIVGFVLGNGQSFQQGEILIPAVIMIAIVCFNVFYTLSQRTQAGRNAEKVAENIRVLAMVTLSLSISIPLVSFIIMWVLVNQ
ncbi:MULTISPECIES: ATP synthase subunit c family protein [Gracilibacillus]|uniref:hypothetical protein n=1 Tax=Gracilibacillus TaxID=74385 RepID=UPI00082670AE|nr:MULTISPECIES: hypothetical protein [Gracilibacillus]